MLAVLGLTGVEALVLVMCAVVWDVGARVVLYYISFHLEFDDGWFS